MQADASLSDWLAWLERAHPQEIELGLDRTRTVAERLTLPSVPVISVAGTNGKGSCVAVASALLQAAGRKVGSYTSPHIQHYCERVCINAEPVSEADMCRAFAAVDSARGEVSLTYFEVGTLAALWLFAQHRVDVCVLEVGLGGRLDAVNIIDADVAVITNIALDHESWLGPDRESIGREKAGIMRRAQPAICADLHPPQTLLDSAAQLGAELLLAGRDFHFNESDRGHWHYRDDVIDGSFAPLALPLPSVAAALFAVHKLGVRLALESLQALLPSIHLPGRMQSLWVEGTQVILDVAHNPAATQHLADKLQNRKATGAVYAVTAFMADKQISAALAPLVPLVEYWTLARLADVPRAASIEQLNSALTDLGGRAQLSGTVEECLHWALAHAGAKDIVLICGSFFTVSAALSLLAPMAEHTGHTLTAPAAAQ